MNNNPKVSIGLPVYNGEKYIRFALDSIINQTFSNFEIIISDNASTDSTEEICREYVNKDSRVKYFRNETNLGAARNYNIVVELSKGEYFKWAAHDDMIAPDYLEKCIVVMEQYQDVSLCYTRRTIIDEHGNKVKFIEDKLFFNDEKVSVRYKKFMKRFRHTTEYCDPVFGLIRMSVLKQTTLIGDYHTSDIIQLAQLLLRGKFYEINDPIFLRRFHPEISTSAFKSPIERAIWFSPRNKGRYQLHRFIGSVNFLSLSSMLQYHSVTRWFVIMKILNGGFSCGKVF